MKQLFDEHHLRRISDAIKLVYPKFEQSEFLKLKKVLGGLEMKARVKKISDELEKRLPKSFSKALEIILQSTEKANLSGFDLWPFTEFIHAHGRKHLELSLNALKKITPLFTAEFAVRPFLIEWRTETIEFLLKCSKDPNVHVRRWASEGTRPRLPWGERLHDFIQEPSLALSILENLKFDSELYVRKSVANHLNDIAKDHPDQVIRILSRWKREAKSEHKLIIEWIIHRALRTLIKAGYEDALKLIGVSKEAKIKLLNFKMNQTSFHLGERMEFSFTVKSHALSAQKLVVDYVIHFVRANQTKSAKVFKLKNFVLEPKSLVYIQKKHHLKKVTTRAHYPGIHWLEIQINGVRLKRSAWELTI